MNSKNQLVEYAEQKINLLITDCEKHQLAKYLIEDVITLLNEEDAYLTLDGFINRINNQEPLQYITGKAYFLDHVFEVNHHVLIPRPETEELVLKAYELIKTKQLNSVLDIGTGSGCIPVSIKYKLPHSKVTAIDVDAYALEVARLNADKYAVDISFMEVDFLNEDNWQALGSYDIIISNPPYISFSEQKEMSKNVLDFEPHKALFAGEDALLFYRKIAKYSKLYNPSAILICELNEYLTEEIKEIFSQYANLEILQDLQGKNRVLVAGK